MSNAVMPNADELKKMGKFKGSFLMYYKDGKNLIFKTTECLYRILISNRGNVIFKLMRKYKKVIPNV